MAAILAPTSRDGSRLSHAFPLPTWDEIKIHLGVTDRDKMSFLGLLEACGEINGLEISTQVLQDVFVKFGGDLEDKNSEANVKNVICYFIQKREDGHSSSLNSFISPNSRVTGDLEFKTVDDEGLNLDDHGEASKNGSFLSDLSDLQGEDSSEGRPVWNKRSYEEDTEFNGRATNGKLSRDAYMEFVGARLRWIDPKFALEIYAQNARETDSLAMPGFLKCLEALYTAPEEHLLIVRNLENIENIYSNEAIKCKDATDLMICLDTNFGTAPSFEESRKFWDENGADLSFDAFCVIVQISMRIYDPTVPSNEGKGVDKHYDNNLEQPYRSSLPPSPSQMTHFSVPGMEKSGSALFRDESLYSRPDKNVLYRAESDLSDFTGMAMSREASQASQLKRDVSNVRKNQPFLLPPSPRKKATQRLSSQPQTPKRQVSKPLPSRDKSKLCPRASDSKDKLTLCINDPHAKDNSGNMDSCPSFLMSPSNKINGRSAKVYWEEENLKEDGVKLLNNQIKWLAERVEVLSRESHEAKELLKAERLRCGELVEKVGELKTENERLREDNATSEQLISKLTGECRDMALKVRELEEVSWNAMERAQKRKEKPAKQALPAKEAKVEKSVKPLRLSDQLQQELQDFDKKLDEMKKSVPKIIMAQSSALKKRQEMLRRAKNANDSSKYNSRIADSERVGSETAKRSSAIGAAVEANKTQGKDVSLTKNPSSTVVFAVTPDATPLNSNQSTPLVSRATSAVAGTKRTDSKGFSHVPKHPQRSSSALTDGRSSGTRTPMEYVPSLPGSQGISQNHSFDAPLLEPTVVTSAQTERPKNASVCSTCKCNIM